jgi:hypothetical protein
MKAVNSTDLFLTYKNLVDTEVIKKLIQCI